MIRKQIYIFALAAHGGGISGSDRIFIEFAKRWVKICSITIYAWQEGYEMCQRQGLDVSSIKFQISSMKPWRYLGFLINYFARIIEGIRVAVSLKLENSENTIIYSASEFWMDSLTTFILKLRYPNIKWVASWYQTAPLPWKGFTEGDREKKHYLSTLLYYLIQLPIKPLIEKWSNLILINNEEERKTFPRISEGNKLMVVLGAVDTKEIKKWRIKFKNMLKIYDGVFQGRFHPQKGVLELIDIWKLVTDQKNNAKLVMIGDGPLMKDVKEKIHKLGLEKNILLKGYLFDGEEKYKIFSQSKVVMHPSFYDSGGMAAAEAMAFGIPAVAFDLKSFKSYYPQGMIKVRIGDLNLFAQSILELLNDESKREKIGRNALNMINISWSWDERAKEVLKSI